MADEPLASKSDLGARLGVELPADYRAFLEEENGTERFFGEAYLVLFSIDALPGLGQWGADSIPGLVVIGSDGGGEGVALDFRHGQPSVVLIPLVGGATEDVIFQAPTFSAFMAQRRAGEPYRFKE